MSLFFRNGLFNFSLKPNASTTRTPVAPVYDWDPLDLPNSVVWLDTADPTTVTLSGSSVSKIVDKTANLYTIVQAVPSNQPDVATKVNGRTVFDYDGDDAMTGSISLPSSGNCSFSLICSPTIVTDTEDSLFSISSANGFQFDANNISQFNGRINSTVASLLGISGGPYATITIFEIIFDFDNNTLTVYANGTAVGSVNDYNTKLDASATLLLSVNAAATQALDSLQGDFIVTEDITTADRQLREGYLACKFDVQASLPTGHPFKIDCPDRTKNYLIIAESGIVVVDGVPAEI